MLRTCPPPSWRSTFFPQSVSRLASAQARAYRYQRSFASIARDIPSHKAGDVIHGFSLEAVQAFPELEMQAYKLRHQKTGAEYLHLSRDDPNNVFSIGFKTNPPDATGVPHILEHTTLCGSEQYPVRDPFFKMLPRSLSNFMNAFTSSDNTMYPFATTNAQDFKNLLAVYMDATLHPLLKESDFRQEGWRIGPEHPEGAPQDSRGESDLTNPLVFKGVVYNEMKGMMSDASYLFYIRFHEAIAPSLNNSGGDPEKITDLTYAQLRKFHADNYHPSNAKIFTYGDLPLEENLIELDRPLQAFGSSMADKTIKDPIDLSNGPLNITIDGPVDSLAPPEKQYRTSTSWVIGDNSDIVTRFSLGLVASLLTDGYGSPMYRALIESGLGQSFSPNTGFGQTGTKAVFSLGAIGVEESNVNKVKQLIADTLVEVYKKGFDKVKIDGILHQLELGLKHKTASFGMGIMQRLAPDWFNGVDPFKSLGVQSIIEEFKVRYAKPGYLEGLLKDSMLNDKTFTFTMRPSPVFSEAQAEEEKSRLAQKIGEVTLKYGGEQKAVKELQKQELELLQEQNVQQDLSVLPTLSVTDIPRSKAAKEVTRSKIGNVPVQWREAPTNGITYIRAINVFKDLPEDLRKLVPLFTDCIMRIGTKDMTMEQLEEQIKLKVGDVSMCYHSATSVSDISGWEQGFKFTGYAIDRNVPAMYDLLQKLVRETNFDSPQAEAQVRELLEMSAATTSDAISEAGNSYATRYAQAILTPEGEATESTGGLTQLRYTLELSKEPSLKDVITRLKIIQQLALSDSGNLRVAVTCGKESRASNEQLLSQFLAGRPSAPPNLTTSTNTHLSKSAPSNKTFIAMPFQVSYVGLALPGVPYTDPRGASLSILAQLLTFKHLHPAIRERGGAYGAGARYAGLGGTFTFSSYRDPNPANSLRVMRNAGAWAVSQNFSAQDIEEAKISVFKGLDSPESVHAEGMVEFEASINHAQQQARREQLLDVTEQDIKRAAEEFLFNGIGDAREVVIGGRPIKSELDWKLVKNLNL